VEYAIETDDVICAAASAILQAVRLGLEHYAGVAIDAKRRPFRLRWPKARRDDEAVRAIVATAELSVEQLARQYPEYLTILRKREPPLRKRAAFKRITPRSDRRRPHYV
jgi:uncharacterized protein YsxB (DUF464 family)